MNKECKELMDEIMEDTLITIRDCTTESESKKRAEAIEDLERLSKINNEASKVENDAEDKRREDERKKAESKTKWKDRVWTFAGLAVPVIATGIFKLVQTHNAYENEKELQGFHSTKVTDTVVNNNVR